MKVDLNTNTRLQYERIRQAYDKKPTASTLQMKGVKMTPTRVLNGKRNIVKRAKIVHLDKAPPLVEPKSSVVDTPDWFQTKFEIPDVSVIIPIYKSKDYIDKQIKSWQWDDKLKIEIIYVDDCCPQQSHLQIIKSWSVIENNGIGKIILNDSNSGYAHACNVGASFSKAKHLIFLNADTLMKPNWIGPMIDLLESDPSIGMVGNMQISTCNDKLIVDSAGSEWSWSKETFEHIGKHSYHGKPLPMPIELKKLPDDLNKPSEREMVTGCCFAMPSTLFNSIGGFDNSYRVGYWEDSEICMQVKHAGYKIYFQPESKIYHKVGHTGSGGHAYMTANKNRFFNRWVKSGIIDQYVADKRTNPFKISTISIKRTAANGDVLAAAAITYALKKQYPGCKIVFETKVPVVLEKHPCIDYVSTNIDHNQYDRHIDLDLVYEKHPKIPIMQAYANEALVDVNDCKLFVHDESFSPLPANYVVVAIQQTNWAGRNWHVNFINDICKRIQTVYPVVLIGNENDKKIGVNNFDLDLRGQTSISQLANIIKRSKAFVGIDSLPMWIAQCFNIPGVCFFGSILPELRIITPNMIGVNAKQLPCIGCHHSKPAPVTATTTCKIGHTYCEDLVTPDLMWDKVKFVLESVK